MKKPIVRFASAGALLAAAGVFKFAMRGYAYIAYALAFFAVLILLQYFIGKTLLWKILIVFVCLGLLLFAFLEVLIVKNSFTEDCGDTDYLIVLGAAVYGKDMSLALTRRCEGAYDFLVEHPETTVIVSGGQGSGEDITEAQAMHDWFIAQGFPEERILMEDRSTSTAENLEYSFDIIRERGDDPDGNVAIVSGSYHLYRAKTMAKMLGVSAKGVRSRPGLPVCTLNFYIREAFGVVKLYVLGM